MILVKSLFDLAARLSCTCSVVFFRLLPDGSGAARGADRMRTEPAPSPPVLQQPEQPAGGGGGAAPVRGRG